MSSWIFADFKIRFFVSKLFGEFDLYLSFHKRTGLCSKLNLLISFIQSEKSKKAGNGPPTIDLVDFLKTSYGGCSEILLLEEDMNFNSRAASLSVSIV